MKWLSMEGRPAPRLAMPTDRDPFEARPRRSVAATMLMEDVQIGPPARSGVWFRSPQAIPENRTEVDPISDPKRFFPELLPVAGIAIHRVCGDVNSRNRP